MHHKKERWGKKREREGSLEFISCMQNFVLTFMQSRACPFLLMYDHVHLNYLRMFFWFWGLNSLGLGAELSESRAPTFGINFPWSLPMSSSSNLQSTWTNICIWVSFFVFLGGLILLWILLYSPWDCRLGIVISNRII